MFILYPCKVAKDISLKYNTSDPFEICSNLGIHILYAELPERIYGFFQNFNDTYIIYINNMLEEEKIDNVVGHELGHILMHSELNTLFLKENTYTNINKFEREADIFSAYLNIDKYDEDVNIDFLCNVLEIDEKTMHHIISDKKFNNLEDKSIY